MVSALFDLKGKIALVTGSTRGLGFGIARGLCRGGAKTIINGRNRNAVYMAAQKLKQMNFDCEGYPFDITDREQSETAIREIIERNGPIDILVNNAGVQHRAPIEQFPSEKWDSVMNVNLNSPYWISRCVIPDMMEVKQGKIINMCSLTSDFARKTISAYSVSKAGLKMLTKSMATELGQYNIQVNAIGPGYFATEMNTALIKNREFNSWVLGRTPANRWGTTEDIEGIVIFLSSKASDYINGQLIYVDGGFSANLGGP